MDFKGLHPGVERACPHGEVPACQSQRGGIALPDDRAYELSGCDPPTAEHPIARAVSHATLGGNAGLRAQRLAANGQSLDAAPLNLKATAGSGWNDNLALGADGHLGLDNVLGPAPPGGHALTRHTKLWQRL